MNRVLILIGPSGCGKTTIANELDKTLDFVRATTDTTRPPRKGERDGVDYNFVTEEWLIEHKSEYIEVNHFIEKGWYGSNALRIDRARANADCVIALEINGARKVKEYYGSDTVFVIYVKRERAFLINALEQRVADGEMSPHELDERIKKIDIDMESEFDPAVDLVLDNNGTIADSVKQIYDFVENDYGRIKAE